MIICLVNYALLYTCAALAAVIQHVTYAVGVLHKYNAVVLCFVTESYKLSLYCIIVFTIFRTLYKQGPYGSRPVIHRSLIITPGSLVKVSFLLFYVPPFCDMSQNGNVQLLFAAVDVWY